MIKSPLGKTKKSAVKFAELEAKIEKEREEKLYAETARLEQEKAAAEAKKAPEPPTPPKSEPKPKPIPATPMTRQECMAAILEEQKKVKELQAELTQLQIAISQGDASLVMAEVLGRIEGYFTTLKPTVKNMRAVCKKRISDRLKSV